MGEGGEPAEEEAHAPRTPEEDPGFKQTVGKIGRTRKAQAAHAPPTDKQKQMGDAALLPEKQQHQINDRDAHFKEIGKTAEKSKNETAEESKKKRFTPEEFRTKLNESIKKIPVPETEDAAKKFTLEGAKQSIRGQVEEQTQNVVGPLANKVGVAQPPDSKLPVTKPGELVEEKAGGEPTPISRTAAAPKPRLDNEISLGKESASLDELMAKNKPSRLPAVSNEPQFLRALDAKKTAQQKAAEAPSIYREGEQKVLEKAGDRAERAGTKSFGEMFKTRNGAFTTVFAKQKSTAVADKAEQVRIQGQLNDIYARATKSDVDKHLELLTRMVDTFFSFQMEVAKNIFEARVEDRLDDIYGWTRLDDKLFGEDTEAINAVFSQKGPLPDDDNVLDQIAALIATSLNTAIARIETGSRPRPSTTA